MIVQWRATIALRIDDVSVDVCPRLPFSFAFPTIENGSVIWNPLTVNFGLFLRIFLQ